MGVSKSRQALVATLRQELNRWQEGCSAQEPLLSTGSLALDRLLPWGGLRRGTLVEYLASSDAGGAGTLALATAREACGEGRALVVLDRIQARSASEGLRLGHFYPPAAAAWGIDLSRLLVLRPVNEADALWALDQALRCRGVGAVWARWNEFDARDFRRLQLAAEEGGTMGLFIRPVSRRGRPTWAQVQWLVRTAESKVEGRKSKVESRRSKVDGLPSWRLHVELVRCPGGAGGQSVLLALDEAAGVWREAIDATNTLPIPAELADSAPARRA